MGPKHAAMLGVKEAEYLPAKMTIQVANNRTTRVLGMAIFKMTTVGTNRTTRQQAYIIETGDQLYLSHQALRDLSCLLENYPEADVTNEKGKLGQVTEGEEERRCICPNRARPPDLGRFHTRGLRETWTGSRNGSSTTTRRPSSTCALNRYFPNPGTASRTRRRR